MIANKLHISRSLSCLLLLTSGFFLPSASAQPPALIHYQGRLVDGTNLVNGTVQLALNLYDASVGGTLLYTDLNPAVPVVDGLYNTYLGDDTTFGNLDAALTNAQVWLEITVGTDTLTPRERLVAVPYARQVHGLLVTTNHGVALNPIGGTNTMPLSAQHATIGGGTDNQIVAGSHYATIPGGRDNMAVLYSFAAGRRAKAEHIGAFLWADSSDVNFPSAANNEFAVRAGGGVRFVAPFVNLGGGTFMGSGGGLTNISGGALVSGTVSNVHLSANAVSTIQLTNNAVTAAKVDAATFNTTFWQASGNAGTTPGTHFIGTTDSQAFEVHVNGARALRIEPHGTSPRIIGGHSANSVIAWGGATIGGGGSFSRPNTADGMFATVAGGEGNSAVGVLGPFGHSTVGGGEANTASAGYATIAGGLRNSAPGIAASIIGGWTNTASGSYSVVGGGQRNIASTNDSAVLGGEANTASGSHSVVGGGWTNTASGDFSTASGGLRNTASGFASVAGGGYQNTTYGDYNGVGAGMNNITGGNYSYVGGGENSVASGNNSMVGGGGGNEASGQYSTVSGGRENKARGGNSTISGGDDNRATNTLSTVGGGFGNHAYGPASTIGGGTFNTAGGQDATVSGGRSNQANGDYAGIGAGRNNSAGGTYSFVGGGSNSVASGNFSVVGGGWTNTASGNYAVLAGGQRNLASGTDSVVAGGVVNHATALRSAIGGGGGNLAEGQYATIPGGHNNVATNYAFAAGRRALALHQGAFVWGDSTDSDIESTAADQVTFRAAGGFRVLGSLGVNTEPAYEMHARGNNPSIMIENTANTPAYLRFKRAADGANDCYIGIGSAGALNFRVNNADRMIIQTNGFVGIGTMSPTNRLHVIGNVQASAFITSSDREAKENIQPVSSEAILKKVVSLPIATWTFKDEPGGTHIGPMAQDFHAAFGFGATDAGIATVDADGVAFAAIQALAEENARLRTELDAIKQHLGLQ